MSSTLSKEAQENPNIALEERLRAFFKNPVAEDTDVVNICREKADAGDGDAMAWFARMYREGKGVPQNIDKAVEWMRKAADKNVGWAKNELFDILWKIGTPESTKEMIAVATDFAKKGDGNAMGRLGRAYRDGKGVPQDLDKAAEWMRKAADKNVGWAKNELFDILWKIGTPESTKEMIAVATDFAKKGDGNAMGRLGRAYRDGKGVPQDLDKAAEWMRKAADKNVRWAKNELFDMLWKRGSPEDYEEMIQIILPLAKTGDGNAMGRLGRAYRHGKGVPQDLNLAAEWMRKAADKNVRWAKNELTTLEEFQTNGKSCRSRDEHLNQEEEFDKQWQRAQNGDYNSIKDIVNSYQKGIGVEKNIGLAIFWSRRLQPKSKEDLRRHVNLLLMSERDVDHREAYSICNEESKSQDGWFRETLALMVWNGIGTKTDRVRAKKIMNKCRIYIRAFPIQPFTWFSSKIYSFDKVYIFGTDDIIRNILCACFQNNLKVNGIISDDAKYDSIRSTSFERISIDNIQSLKRCAIILDSDSVFKFDRCLSSDSALFTYQDFKSVHGHNSLFEINEALDNFEEYVVICDDTYKNDLLDYRISQIGTDKAVTFLTTSEFQHYSEQKEEYDSQKAFLLLSDCNLEFITMCSRKGLKNNNFFFEYITKFMNHNCLVRYAGSATVVSFEDLAFKYLLGQKIFRALPEKVNYFICSWGSMGDQYRCLCKTNGLSQHYGLDSTCVLVNRRAKDLPVLFGYKGIVLSNGCHGALMSFLRFNKYFDRNKISVLGPRVASNAGTQTDTYGPTMHLPVGSSPSMEHYSPTYIPYDSIRYSRPIEYSEDEDYRDSVLINPYGKYILTTAPEFTKDVIAFFEKLVFKLSEKNVSVYTNSINDSQHPIKGTKILRKSISDTVFISRDFKAIVTVYTGFMETVIFTDANLYVITPDKRLSRAKMAEELHKRNYEEFVYDASNIDKTVDSVFDRVMSNRPSISKRSEDKSDCMNITNNVRSESFIPEYVQLCNEFPEWRGRIFSEMFSGMETNEINVAVGKIASMSQHDKSAMYFMGRILDSRLVQDTDINGAIHYMSAAVLAGAIWANNELFDMLWKRGSPEDYEEMIQIILPLAKTGDGNAMGRLGRAYRHGKGVPQDLNLAAEWMRKAADKNVRWAKNELFDMLWKRGSPEDYEEMIQIILPLAKTGDGNAMGRLGRAYRHGKGVPQDLNLAAEWMRKAADKNVRWAKNELFDMLWKRGSPEDYEEMIQIILPLAKTGDGNAMGRLGRAYRHGKGVPQDLNLAAEWMRKAADKNVRWAKNELFDMLWKRGSPEDYEEMIQIILPLAKTGDGNAMGRLGRAYRHGKGVPQDLNLAAEWMRKAADKNVRWAKNELFDMQKIKGGVDD